MSALFIDIFGYIITWNEPWFALNINIIDLSYSVEKKVTDGSAEKFHPQ